MNNFILFSHILNVKIVGMLIGNGDQVVNMKLLR
jgi:hypothetical protein